MSNYYLAQIGIYGFNFAPKGWAFCTGNIIPIAQNTALYSLIGTTYGGNGQSTFGLPDLRSRTPVNQGAQTSMGEMYGVENVTLLITEMPAHTHVGQINTNPATASASANNTFGATTSPALAYVAPAGNTVLNAGTISMYGGNQPHSNIQPYLTLNYCIATTGYYPARN